MESTSWRDRETLREMYVEDDMSSHEIAETLGCHPRTVNKWVNKFGFDTGIMSQSEKESKRGTSVMVH